MQMSSLSLSLQSLSWPGAEHSRDLPMVYISPSDLGVPGGNLGQVFFLKFNSDHMMTFDIDQTDWPGEQEKILYFLQI